MNDILQIIHTPFHEGLIQTRATERRRQNYLDQCAEQGIKFNICPGVVQAGRATYQNITVAHQNIVRKAKENNWERVIVAEDDLKFSCSGAWKYFLEQMPEVFDFYCGLIYHGTVEDGRILSAFSGGLTLYAVHNQFYDVFLSCPVAENVHLDRHLGSISEDYGMYVCQPAVVTQLGGYSFNLVRNMTYELYEESIEFYKG